MKIRTFKHQDQEQIKALSDNFFKNKHKEEKTVLSYEDPVDLSKVYDGQGNSILVAEEESKIIGFVSVKEESADTALIKRLLVHNDYRRRNYGQQLLKRAIDFCRIKGYKNVLFKSTARMKPAINLCLKNGFDIIKEKDLNNIRIIELALKIKN